MAIRSAAAGSGIFRPRRHRPFDNSRSDANSPAIRRMDAHPKLRVTVASTAASQRSRNRLDRICADGVSQASTSPRFSKRQKGLRRLCPATAGSGPLGISARSSPAGRRDTKSPRHAIQHSPIGFRTSASTASAGTPLGNSRASLGRYRSSSLQLFPTPDSTLRAQGSTSVFRAVG